MATPSEPSPKRVAFWDFSKAVYAQPGVKEACLKLQSGGLDVNVALWIVWTVIYGRDPGPAVGAAVERSALWSAQVVKPLRSARTGLKFPPDFIDGDEAAALRKTVLGAELDAERLEQLALEGLSQSCPEHSADDLRGLAWTRLESYALKLNATVESAAFIQTVFDALENV